MSFITFKAFLPEIFLSIALMLQLVFNTKTYYSWASTHALLTKELLVQTAFILLITLFLVINIKVEGSYYSILVIDSASYYIKIIFLITCLLLLLPIWQSYNIQKVNFFEFFTIFLIIVLVSLLLISCCDFFLAFLLLEIQAFCFYILAGIKRDSVYSVEAAVKYFILGSIFSCFFLYGLANIHVQYGATDFYSIGAYIKLSTYDGIWFNNPFIKGFLIIMLVLLFKLGIAPFHFWVADIYDGAPLSATIIFSVLPKMVLITLLTRICIIGFPYFVYFNYVFLFFGIFSVVVGTIYALNQKRLKLFFIFSSVSQLGFVFTSFFSFSEEAITSVYFFMILYNITAVIGWFFVCSAYTHEHQELQLSNDSTIKPIYLAKIAGLYKVNKFWALVIVMYFFSLAGIPPFLGFFGKLYIFLVLAEANNIIIILLLMLLAGISSYYYIRLIKIVIYEPENKNKGSTTLFSGNYKFLYEDFYALILCSCVFFLFFSFFSYNKLFFFS